MWRMLWGLVVFLAVVNVQGSTWFERYKEFFNEVLPNNQTLMSLWKTHLKLWEEKTRIRKRYPIPHFQCHLSQPHNNHQATSVHDLHPGDIRVIGAIGDSLTAGNGIMATNIIGDLVEYRGRVWSIGGDESLATVVTLPNILKQFGQYLYGYSLAYGKRTNPQSYLNMADPGDVAADMPGQAQMMVDRLKTDPAVRYHDDWKVITVFVGGNDMCDYCNDRARYSPQNYAAHLRDALDILHQIPKTFVNLVEIFDIAPIAAMEGGFLCNIVHSFVCPCGKDKNNAQELKTLTEGYQNAMRELVFSGRYDTRDDFTVVLQPFFKHTEPPTLGNGAVDLDFFSPDCFHFNQEGQSAAALSLWNNMLEAPQFKQEEWHLYGDFHCPGTHRGHDHTFFTTYKNSV